MATATAAFWAMAQAADHFYPAGKNAPAWLDRCIGTAGMFYLFFMFMCVKSLIFPAPATPPAEEPRTTESAPQQE